MGLGLRVISHLVHWLEVLFQIKWVLPPFGSVHSDMREHNKLTDVEQKSWLPRRSGLVLIPLELLFAVRTQPTQQSGRIVLILAARQHVPKKGAEQFSPSPSFINSRFYKCRCFCDVLMTNIWKIWTQGRKKSPARVCALVPLYPKQPKKTTQIDSERISNFGTKQSGWILYFFFLPKNVMDGSRRFLVQLNYPAEKYLSKESCKSFAEIKYKFLLIYEAILNVPSQKSLNISSVSFSNIYYEVGGKKRDEHSRPCIIWALSHFSRYVFWLSSAWASLPSNLQSRVCGTLLRGTTKTKHALALISAAQNLRQTFAPSAKCFIAGRVVEH